MSDPGSHYDIAVEHTFTASPDKVFDAWLNPQRVENWFGPGSLLRLVHTIDPQWKDYADKIHQSWLAMMKKWTCCLLHN